MGTFSHERGNFARPAERVTAICRIRKESSPFPFDVDITIPSPTEQNAFQSFVKSLIQG
jgi:hypothetical protein